MNITINPEDLTAHDLLALLHWFKGRRCWFSLTGDDEVYFTTDHERRTRPRRLVATVQRVFALPDFRIGVDTTEGTLYVGDFFSIEPYERFVNDGKDRYTPS